MLDHDDIRYRAKCFVCNAGMGDWALNLPKKERLCWDHRKHTVADIEKRFGSKRVDEDKR